MAVVKHLADREPQLLWLALGATQGLDLEDRPRAGAAPGEVELDGIAGAWLEDAEASGARSRGQHVLQFRVFACLPVKFVRVILERVARGTRALIDGCVARA